jgi:hypothetical protein
MSLEIGPLPPNQPSTPAKRAANAAQPGFTLDLARVDTVELSLPAFPPPEVLDAVGAAADRAEELAAADRELHFRVDDDTGRVIVEVRDFEGNVIRTIPPSAALDVMAGASV